MVWSPPVSLASAKDKTRYVPTPPRFLDLVHPADPALVSLLLRAISFAYESTVHRWPAILTQVIDSIYSANYALSYSRTNQSAKIDEGKQIIEKIAALKHDMSRDRPLEPIGVVSGKDADEGPSTELFDSVIDKEHWTWFQAPWLFAECYLYRLLRTFFARSQHWKQYDPFSKTKLDTFKSSGNAISALAVTIEELVAKSLSSEQGPESTPQGREILFHEMAQMSLWGNATDLSLLTNLSYADLQALQTTGREQQQARSKYILANDLDKAWTRISSLNNGRVDIVLDNAGFELVTDMIFADWLLTTPARGRSGVPPQEHALVRLGRHAARLPPHDRVAARAQLLCAPGGGAGPPPQREPKPRPAGRPVQVLVQRLGRTGCAAGWIAIAADGRWQRAWSFAAPLGQSAPPGSRGQRRLDRTWPHAGGQPQLPDGRGVL
ncbi:hypothetical protein L1887_55778 [Cichorium endivia]|nr:hypothetical protein L1887_55778 [Cichorium endivia]